ncbi:MAG TPA: L,D-transpeptidase, partial [Casimicrobiaceae bacterium]
MRIRLLLATFFALALCAAPASAQDPRVIGAGTTVKGIDVSGLTVDAAAAKLDGALTKHLTRTTVVAVGARRFRLGAPIIGLQFDALRSAKRAFYASQKGPSDVVPALVWSRAAVNGWADVVRKRSTRAPRNATVKVTVRRVRVTGSRIGTSVNTKVLAKAVNAALSDPAAKRRLRVPVVKVQPKVTYKSLLRSYGTVLTIDRDNFRLRLFKRFRFAKSYGIAVGMAGLDTPAGLYTIQSKQVNPAWHVPNSSWAGSMAGQTVPGGAPNNPLKARWL